MVKCSFLRSSEDAHLHESVRACQTGMHLLQTRSQRYTKMFWLTLLQAEKPFEDVRIEAEQVDGGKCIEIKTTNTAALWLDGDDLKLNDRIVHS